MGSKIFISRCHRTSNRVNVIPRPDGSDESIPLLADTTLTPLPISGVEPRGGKGPRNFVFLDVAATHAVPLWPTGRAPKSLLKCLAKQSGLNSVTRSHSFLL